MSSEMVPKSKVTFARNVNLEEHVVTPVTTPDAPTVTPPADTTATSKKKKKKKNKNGQEKASKETAEDDTSNSPTNAEAAVPPPPKNESKKQKGKKSPAPKPASHPLMKHLEGKATLSSKVIAAITELPKIEVNAHPAAVLSGWKDTSPKLHALLFTELTEKNHRSYIIRVKQKAELDRATTALWENPDADALREKLLSDEDSCTPPGLFALAKEYNTTTTELVIFMCKGRKFIKSAVQNFKENFADKNAETPELRWAMCAIQAGSYDRHTYHKLSSDDYDIDDTVLARNKSGEHGEELLKELLEKAKVCFTTESQRKENELLTQQNACVPDFMFNPPVVLDGVEVNWMDAKNMLVIPSLSHQDVLSSIRKQGEKYTERFGPGAFVWTKMPFCETLSDVIPTAHYSCKQFVQHHKTGKGAKGWKKGNGGARKGAGFRRGYHPFMSSFYPHLSTQHVLHAINRRSFLSSYPFYEEEDVCDSGFHGYTVKRPRRPAAHYWYGRGFTTSRTGPQPFFWFADVADVPVDGVEGDKDVRVRVVDHIDTVHEYDTSFESGATLRDLTRQVQLEMGKRDCVVPHFHLSTRKGAAMHYFSPMDMKTTLKELDLHRARVELRAHDEDDCTICGDST